TFCCQRCLLAGHRERQKDNICLGVQRQLQPAEVVSRPVLPRAILCAAQERHLSNHDNRRGL
ncbi:unnamed protein product, partial [Clonostachys chloroleuca]